MHTRPGLEAKAAAVTKSMEPQEFVTFADLSLCKKVLAIVLIFVSLLLVCSLPVWAIACFVVALLLAPAWWCVAKLHICIFSGGPCSEDLGTKLSATASCCKLFTFLFLEQLWLPMEAIQKLWALVIPNPTQASDSSSKA